MQKEAVKRLSTNGHKPARSLEELCDAGRRVADVEDDAHWKLGELALEVETAYGADNIETFAKSVGKAKKTVYEYRKVYGYYSNILPLAEYREANPMLRYSHYRDARRLKDQDAILAFLDECSDNGYTVDEARFKLSERVPPAPKAEPAVPPPPLVDAVTCRIMGTGNGQVFFQFEDPALAQVLYRLWQANKGKDLVMTLTRKDQP